MTSRLLFLGGLPAAGKSTLSESLARDIPSLAAINAGSLIPKDRLSLDVTERQRSIIEAVSALRRPDTAPSLILDGHYTLQAGVDVSRVEPRFFVELGIDDYFILLQAPELIATRLRQRAPASNRWWDGTSGQVAALQDLELAHAREVASLAGKPLHALTGDRYDQLRVLVEGRLSGS
jgi:adenylate kinase